MSPKSEYYRTSCTLHGPFTSVIKEVAEEILERMTLARRFFVGLVELGAVSLRNLFRCGPVVSVSNHVPIVDKEECGYHP